MEKEIRAAQKIVDDVITRLGLWIVRDRDVITACVKSVFKENNKAVNDKAIGFLVGKVLKQIKQADPIIVREIIEQELESNQGESK